MHATVLLSNKYEKHYTINLKTLCNSNADACCCLPDREAVVNPVSAKPAHLQHHIYCARSGWAAGAQPMADTAVCQLELHKYLWGPYPTPARAPPGAPPGVPGALQWKMKNSCLALVFISFSSFKKKSCFKENLQN